MLPDFAIQGALAHAQAAGGPQAVAAMLGQHLADVITLQFIHAHVRQMVVFSHLALAL